MRTNRRPRPRHEGYMLVLPHQGDVTKRRRRKYRTRTRENRCTTCGNLRNEEEECQNPFCPMFRGPQRKIAP
jgi:hypothetical protein